MIKGNLRKMIGKLGEDGLVSYKLPIGDENIDLNKHLGHKITLEFQNIINCIDCGRKTNKSFSQGFCFPCVKSLAKCDMCMVKPELCHYHKGTCREPEWGEKHCMKQHYIYLSYTSGMKVGITRQEPPIGRWIDQGATLGLAIAKCNERLDAGKIETALKEHIADKTNWRKLLQQSGYDVDLHSKFKELQQYFPSNVDFEFLERETVSLTYPVDQFPEKIKSHNFDKIAEVTGILQGIKGQYIILDTGVLNIRKHAGYFVHFSSSQG